MFCHYLIQLGSLSVYYDIYDAAILLRLPSVSMNGRGREPLPKGNDQYG